MHDESGDTLHGCHGRDLKPGNLLMGAVQGPAGPELIVKVLLHSCVWPRKCWCGSMFPELNEDVAGQACLMLHDTVSVCILARQRHVYRNVWLVTCMLL
jgi:hypothetical protein